MNIAIGCTQRFDITVTPKLIALLTKLGSTHYDGACKDAVKCGPGGFIYGWGNMIAFAEVGETIVVLATNDKLQTCLKICENFPPGLSAEESALQNKFVQLGYAALRQAGEDPRFYCSLPVGTGS